MQAMIQSRYGAPTEVLALDERPRPTIGPEEVLVEVRASSVNRADWYQVSGQPLITRLFSGPFGPRNEVMGKDVAGVVAEVGAAVTRFRPGDEVYGELEAGAWAELVAAPESALACKPANLTFEEAAAVPLAGVTALQGLRDTAEVRAGQRLLITGASGGVGTFAVQIAKAYGAVVTASTSAGNAAFVASLGADEVIDYAHEAPAGDRDRYDVIFDIAGSCTARAAGRMLTDDGVHVVAGGPIGGIIRAGLASMIPGRRVATYSADPTVDDLDELTRLIEAGAITPALEATFPLADAGDALRRQGTGHAHGKRVISM